MNTRPIRRRNVGVPKFLRHLYDILETEDRSIITWSHDGMSFSVLDNRRMESEILPRYFKHSKISSFHRQLNYFGFRKWLSAPSKIPSFSHSFFIRGERFLLKNIKRSDSRAAHENKCFNICTMDDLFGKIKPMDDQDLDILNAILTDDAFLTESELELTLSY